MPVDVTVLGDELRDDPYAVGYGALGTDDFVGRAELVNRIRSGSPPVDVSWVAGEKLVRAVKPGEWLSTPPEGRELFALIVQVDRVELRDPLTRTQLKQIFAGKSITLSELEALETRPQSRAEELFGVGVVVTASQCREALRP